MTEKIYVIEWYDLKKKQWKVANVTMSETIHRMRKIQLLNDGLRIKVYTH